MVILILLLSGFGFFSPSSEPSVIKPCKVIYCKANDKLLVLSEEPHLILQIDRSAGTILNQEKLQYKPSGAVFNKAGDRLYVTSNGHEGRILEINTNDLKVLRDFSSGGHTPLSPVLSADEQSLYVCNRFNNEVCRIDLAKGKIVNRYKVVREPVSIVLSGDGQHLFAGNLLPGGRADAERVNAVISVINLQNSLVENIELPNGSNSIGDLALSPDGEYIYVSHILARFQVPTTQIERGWINTNALSIIDVEKEALFGTVLLDDIDLGFSNPRAIGFSPDGTSLLVTSFGGNELSVINLAKLHSMIEKRSPQGNTADNYYSDLANDLSTMCKINRKRIILPGYGPNSLVVAGNNAYITEYYSGTLSVLDLSEKQVGYKQQMVFGNEDPFSDTTRYGELLFNSADLCFQKWQSCASCHPDGRVDGLNWDLLNDGIGNPKNSKSMLYSHVTPPSMSLGIRSTAEQAVRAGIRFIQFAAVDEKKARAIDIYLKSLRPEPSPYLNGNKLSRNASHGKKYFESEGCITCHPSPLYTDLKKYDLKNGKGMDKDKAFDNPTLIEAWRTTPYMHDGSVETMDELIRIHNPYGKSSLSEKERAALAEFVLSL